MMIGYRDNVYDNDDDDDVHRKLNDDTISQDDSSTSSIAHESTPPIIKARLAFGSARIARDRNDKFANEQRNDDADEVDSIATKLQDMELMPLTKDIDIYNETVKGITNDEVLSTLTSEQQEAIKKIEAGENVYIRGNAGTGKSFLLLKLKIILENLKKTSVFVAPTGIGAESIGGVTIHSYFNIDINNPYLFKKTDIEKRDVIVIDEISMLSGELFDILNNKCMKLWNTDTIMGGAQVIVVGDFYQLSPFDDTNLKRKRGNCPLICQNRGYAFQSKVWSDLKLCHVALTEAKRQTNPEFYNVLNMIRKGEMEDKYYDYLQQNNTKSRRRLYCNNCQVDSYNSAVYDKFKDTHEEKYYCAYIQNQQINFEVGNKNTNTKVLKLKVGVEVYLTANLKLHSPPFLVNGSRGKVRDFMSVDEVLKQLREEKESIKDNYQLEDYITCLVEIVIAAKNLTSSYPVVEFTDQDGKKFRRCILPFRKYENNRLEVEMPLTYSWAMKVNKSQGLSFDSLTINLAGCRSLACAYVGLSRCKDVTKLCVENISILKNLVKTGPDARVTDFYENGKTELWTSDNINDYFEVSDDSKFQCISCEGSSKACYNFANPPLSELIIEKMKDKPNNNNMVKIMDCLAREECITLDHLKIAKKSLTEDYLRVIFSNAGIPALTKEGAITAILSLMEDST